MKKSLLAAGVVAALGGLGFAGSAHALWAVGGAPVAQTLSAATNTGIGHILLTPYYSAVAKDDVRNATLLSIVNTDTKNGKAVKVRFRGAANSDDVLDFTVLLSPGDVWSANVTRGEDGFARLVTPDTSCVLPNIPTVASGGVGFSNARLDPTLSAEVQGFHTQEGYVEWLNMADISPNQADGTTAAVALKGASEKWTLPEKQRLYDVVKHKDNVAPCDSAVMDWLMDSREFLSQGDAATYGILPPSGGLMGNWAIVNTANVTSYGGPSSAIVAQSRGENGFAAVSAPARLFFTPQIGPKDPHFPVSADVPFVDGNARNETADPLLASVGTGGTEPPAIKLMPFDLPDLSTPYVASSGGWAPLQSAELSLSLSATKVMNEWTAGADNGTDFSTDWVFSQPTRRYHVAVNYTAKDATGAVKPAVVHNTITQELFYPEDAVTLKKVGPDDAYGSVLCLADGQVKYRIFNREEGEVTPSFAGEWSPQTPADVQPGFCGEVATLTFGSAVSNSLNARLTTYQIGNLPAGGAGWMRAAMDGVVDEDFGPIGLPVIGYAANTFSGSNGSNTGNYGDAITHRYERSKLGAIFMEGEVAGGAGDGSLAATAPTRRLTTVRPK